MSTSVFLNYCLSCDCQIEAGGELYCSQQCRLADLCTSPSTCTGSGASQMLCSQHQSSHNHSTSVASTSSISSTASNRNSSPFVLPPAYDFSSHRNSTVSVASSSTSGSSSFQHSQLIAPPRPASGYFAFAGTGNVLLSSSEAAKKTLSPTSSRSSITSLEDHRNELRMYESNFDQVRDWRRRRASIYESSWR